MLLLNLQQHLHSGLYWICSNTYSHGCTKSAATLTVRDVLNLQKHLQSRLYLNCNNAYSQGCTYSAATLTVRTVLILQQHLQPGLYLFCNSTYIQGCTYSATALTFRAVLILQQHLQFRAVLNLQQHSQSGLYLFCSNTDSQGCTYSATTLSVRALLNLQQHSQSGLYLVCNKTYCQCSTSVSCHRSLPRTSERHSDCFLLQVKYHQPGVKARRRELRAGAGLFMSAEGHCVALTRSCLGGARHGLLGASWPPASGLSAAILNYQSDAIIVNWIVSICTPTHEYTKIWAQVGKHTKSAQV